MNYRILGKTGLKVSEIGFGGEWLERHDEQDERRDRIDRIDRIWDYLGQSPRLHKSC